MVLWSFINLLRHQATITRFSDGEYYNIITLFEGEKTPLNMKEEETLEEKFQGLNASW